MLYTFAVPAYYGKGSRVYALCNFRIGRALKLQVKLGRTLYENRNFTGSSLEEITGSSKTTIRAQLRFKF